MDKYIKLNDIIELYNKSYLVIECKYLNSCEGCYFRNNNLSCDVAKSLDNKDITCSQDVILIPMIDTRSIRFKTDTIQPLVCNEDVCPYYSDDENCHIGKGSECLLNRIMNYKIK